MHAAGGDGRPRSARAESVPAVPLHAVTAHAFQGHPQAGRRDDAGRRERRGRRSALVSIQADAVRIAARHLREAKEELLALYQRSAEASSDQRRAGRTAAERRHRLVLAAGADERSGSPGTPTPSGTARSFKDDELEDARRTAAHFSSAPCLGGADARSLRAIAAAGRRPASRSRSRPRRSCRCSRCASAPGRTSRSR